MYDDVIVSAPSFNWRTTNMERDLFTYMYMYTKGVHCPATNSTAQFTEKSTNCLSVIVLQAYLSSDTEICSFDQTHKISTAQNGGVMTRTSQHVNTCWILQPTRKVSHQRYKMSPYTYAKHSIYATAHDVTTHDVTTHDVTTHQHKSSNGNRPRVTLVVDLSRRIRHGPDIPQVVIPTVPYRITIGVASPVHTTS